MTSSTVVTTLPLLQQLKLPPGTKVTFDGDALTESATCAGLDAEDDDVFDVTVQQSEVRVTVKTRLGAGLEKR